MKKNRAIIFIDSSIATHIPSFFSNNKNSTVFYLPSGETAKSIDVFCTLVNKIDPTYLSKQTIVIGIGGGSILDLSGFIASILLRGLQFYSIPTTLLSMVDASIGGKNGINAQLRKNVIGTFYPAECVFISLEWLDFLPKNLWKSGFAEIIKIGLVASKPLITFINDTHSEIIAGNTALLQDVIEESITLKQSIAHMDMYDTGIRKILNFGHTIGHAYESASHFTIPHGIAVAIGIRAETLLAHKLGFLSHQACNEVLELLDMFGYSKSIIDLSISKEDLFYWMAKDKKNIDDTIHVVMLQEIGKCWSAEDNYTVGIAIGDVDECLYR